MGLLIIIILSAVALYFLSKYVLVGLSPMILNIVKIVFVVLIAIAAYMNYNSIQSKIELTAENKEKLKEISKNLEGSGKAVLLDRNLKELKNVSHKSVSASLKREKGAVIIVTDGSATGTMLKSAEESGIQIVVAKNFQTTDTKIKLLSL